MIVYGQKAVHLNSKKLPTSITCSVCNTQGSIIMSLYSKHAHLFWIPTFPIGKIGVSECQHCKSVLQHKEMPEKLKREYQKLKEDSKTPVWQYSGILLIAGLFAFGAYSSGKSNEKELEYIAAPLAGDVYEYKIEYRKYTTLKVSSVSNDSVFVIPNNYEISKSSKIHKIDKPENYADFSYGISRKKLKEMHDSNEIIDVNR